jgi:hypothetical protein
MLTPSDLERQRSEQAPAIWRRDDRTLEHSSKRRGRRGVVLACSLAWHRGREVSRNKGRVRPGWA